MLRRDFTINGMLLDPIALRATGDLNSAVLDYVGGRDDLAAASSAPSAIPSCATPRTSCACCAPSASPRASTSTLEATARRHPLPGRRISQVCRERIRDELTKHPDRRRRARGFELLYQLGLLARILPEVVRLRGVAQPPQFHPEGDVWVHTMLLLEKLPPACAATLAWGALLHDIGKPATLPAANPGIPGDRIRFNGHVEVGVRIAEEILARLRFSNEDTAQDPCAGEEPHALRRHPGDAQSTLQALPPPAALRSSTWSCTGWT